MDKLTAMQTFVAVVRSGGFSSAARVLGVPKTRVSQRIQDLEAALATRLLNRTTRAVSPTQEGRAYFEQCERILQEIGLVEAEVAGAGERAFGRLSVSVMSGVARHVLLPRMAEFQAANPEVTVRIAATDRISNLAEEGFDCAIRGGAVDAVTMISRHVRDVDFGLYAQPALAQTLTLECPEHLTTTSCVAVVSQRTGSAAPLRLERGGREVIVETAARLEVDDDDGALEACLGGAGVLACPDFVVAPLVRAGRLQRVLPDWGAGVRPIYIIYPSRRFLPVKLRRFIDWSANVIKSA